MIERTMMQGLVSWMRLGSKFCNSAHIVGEKVYNWFDVPSLQFNSHNICQ